MIVEILKDDPRLGIKKGQIYEAERYWLDPYSKVTLLQRLTKRSRKPVGGDPSCNQYRSEVKILEADDIDEVTERLYKLKQRLGLL